ncbi:AraC family transcriptional regulator [Actinokineospora bangkokensis]|uniref:AraC family transcriptional regulator n=1 Tax=Actinokineospora bangkokensis TaxID=1193682 RepID=A0A1Q9LQN4_9PSEU|nr:AraC family transcriptional regulator [Actinokineospora bangkokensis]OLR94357.1 AraC family transcriptional regulator [Actinokineospora bangkokensis]
MDALAALLDGPRAQGAFLLRSVMRAPWSLRVVDEAPLTLVAAVAGESWLVVDSQPPLRLRAGDVAVLRGPEHYTAADDPATEPQIVIGPDQACRAPDSGPGGDYRDLGVRTWGNDPDGETVLLTGTYNLRGAVSERLLSALPPLVALSDAPLIPLLAAEVGKDEPGQAAVLDRLLDLLLTTTLRSWFARPDAMAPAWYRAHTDEVVGAALRLMHTEPARPWTVDALARATGVSRAALARRFTRLVGEPPMAFLTGWRLALAADLLREPGATVGSVAAKVGYGSGFALSTAFKRVHGVSPAHHRKHELAVHGIEQQDAVV